VREILMRLIYCDMLGESVDFGLIAVLNLTQAKKNGIDKRIGYLCASLFLNPNHQLTTLLINSFRMDLISKDDAVVSFL
jgi:hypothetical protein